MTASKSHPPSRRDVVSAGGATLAVAASSPAIAKSSSRWPDEESPALRDPKDKISKPRRSNGSPNRGPALQVG